MSFKRPVAPGDNPHFLGIHGLQYTWDDPVILSGYETVGFYNGDGDHFRAAAVPWDAIKLAPDPSRFFGVYADPTLEIVFAYDLNWDAVRERSPGLHDCEIDQGRVDTYMALMAYLKYCREVEETGKCPPDPHLYDPDWYEIYWYGEPKPRGNIQFLRDYRIHPDPVYEFQIDDPRVEIFNDLSLRRFVIAAVVPGETILDYPPPRQIEGYPEAGIVLVPTSEGCNLPDAETILHEYLAGLPGESPPDLEAVR